MNVTVYDSLVQGSPEWLDARAGLLTASTVGQLLTAGGKPSTAKTADGLLRRLGRERATGRVYEIAQTWQMRRGTDLEPYARDEYTMEHTTEIVAETGFLVRTFGTGARLGYSPDGLVGTDGLLEIKCPNIDRYTDVVLNDSTLPEHMAQLQAGLLVTGREWIDYMTFHPGEVAHVVRVTPDAQWQDTLSQVVEDADRKIDEYADQFTKATAGRTPTPPEIDTYA